MRIKYITPPKVRPGYIHAELCQMLRKELPTCEDVEIVNLSPDIVHVFGIWNSTNAKLVERYRRIGIPVIFTSVNGMLSLVGKESHDSCSIATKTALRRICKSGAVIHTCGKMENSIIKSIARTADTQIIGNALLSATTDAKTMEECLISLYKSTCEANDTNIKQKIAANIDKVTATDGDITITAICARIMYIRQRFIMHNIPQAYLDETSQQMTKSDYDEDKIKVVLKDLNMSQFASYVMTLLNDCSTLTEGFMPIKSTSGKTVENMKKYIIQ